MFFVGRMRQWAIILGCVGAVVLAGCATLPTSETSKTDKIEEALSAAGFYMKLADTPVKQAHLQKLVQHKLVPYNYKGRTVYVYADAANNRLFVGDQQAYQKFQALAVQRQIAREEAQAAALTYGGGINWGLWGPYPWGPYPWGTGPGYYYR
jgi:hypothetical protein